MRAEDGYDAVSGERMIKIILGGLAAVLLLASAVMWMLRPGSQRVEGSAAPDFDLQDQNGQTHRLSDYAGRWLVLYFYPKDDTPGCTREACRFRDDIGVLGNLECGRHRGQRRQHPVTCRILPQISIAVSVAVRPGRAHGCSVRQPAESGGGALRPAPHVHHRAGWPHCCTL